MLARVRSFLNGVATRSRLENDMADELRFHIESRAEDLARSGMPRAEAERRARLEFGAVEAYKESCREARGLRLLDELRQDVRYALRGLRNSPGFTAVAVATLALGIGVNTATFTLVRSVLLRELPYRDPQKLAMVYSVGSFGPFKWDDGSLMDPDIVALAELPCFSAVAHFNTSEVSLTGGGDPVRVSRGAVAASLFPLLGVAPALGRGFVDADEGNPLVVLGDGLWRSRFGADPNAIGRSATIDGVPHTIVGVMPPELNFPAKVKLWTPLKLRPTYRNNAYNRVVTRLAPETTPQQALAALKTLFRNLAEPKDRHEEPGVRVVPLQEALVGKARPLLFLLLGVVLFVLMIACTNLANLLMARAAARRQELSIRTSLGAGRARLLRQLLTESVALSIIGGGLGLLLAGAVLPFVRAWNPPWRSTFMNASAMLPRLEEVRFDVVVLAFTLLLCVASGLLFGVVPALTFARADAPRPDAARGQAGVTRGERSIRSGLIVAETALVLVLLVGAGLLLKSLWRLQNVDPGFRRDRILTMQITLPDRVYEKVSDKRQFYARLLDRLAGVPGVADVSAINLLPFGSLSWKGDFVIEGRDYKPGELIVGKPAVSENYFRALGIPLLRGRVFRETDTEGAPPVAVVSDSVARFCWPNQDALGRRITMDDPKRVKEPRWITVVGVVADIRQDTLAGETLPIIYVPFRQETKSFFMASMSYLMRTEADAASLAATLRTNVHALDPDLPVQHVRMLDRWLEDAVGEPRFRASMLLGLALLALLLALVGIYGVMAYEVTGRTSEIGIRRALGAPTRAVMGLVLGRAAALVTAGLALGLGGAGAVTRVLEKFLFGVTPLDAGVFALVSLCLAAAALLASFVPARRAARVDPAVALRCE
jgi:predicted permease